MSSSRRTASPRARRVADDRGKVVPLPGPASSVLRKVHPAVESRLMAARLLKDVRGLEAPLTTTDRLTLIDQALVLLEQNYVHLPLKQAMHAVRPVQRLKLLCQRVETDDPALAAAWSFHQEMLDIFTSVRDLHTNYILPDPFQRMTAFLPFLIEGYFEDGRARYLVSHVVEGFACPPAFAPGVEITAWSGVPIERAVMLNADRFAGSNPAARRARGIERLTVRPLLSSMPPDEDWVVVGFETADGQADELRIDWLVLDSEEAAALTETAGLKLELASGLGIDIEAEAAGQARKILFAPKAVAAEEKMMTGARPRRGADPLESRRPEMRADVIKTAHGPFAYLRIWTFAPGIPGEAFEDFQEGFVREAARLLCELPDDGLILDVRGNGGGVITAGESLLQLLTPKRIEPERLQFINTPLNLEICRRWGPGSGLDLQPWEESIEQSVRTGAVWSRAFPVTPDEEANRLGQHYSGPVVLITDARCYSTTDIFAAGFQDHGIGKVLGVDRNTGAGGANVWGHDLLSFLMEGSTGTPYQALPHGVRMRVAIRRNLRVGPMAGTPLEDLGVRPDETHPLTRADLLEGNVDLFDHAARLLKDEPRRRFRAGVMGEVDGGVRIRITSEGIERLDVTVDDRPQGSLDWTDGEAEIQVDRRPARHLLLQGYRHGTLVASRRLRFA